MTNQPTPETDELIRTQLARVGMTPRALAARLTLKCEQLERERDAMKARIDDRHGLDDHALVWVGSLTARFGGGE